MAITTKEEFLQYCLRKLGEPVISIDVTDEQLEDRYTEALRKFHDFHFDGTERTYLKHEVTEEDVTNGWIPIDDSISGVIRVLPVSYLGSSLQNPFNLQYQLFMNDMWSSVASSTVSTGISYYYSLRQYTTMLDQLLNGVPIIRFNRNTDRLYIDISWGKKLVAGSWVIVECFRKVDPEEYHQTFNDPWLKHYTSALIKRQWGENLSKYDGVALIGGVTISGTRIYQEALQEIDQLEDELENKYSEPVMFAMG